MAITLAKAELGYIAMLTINKKKVATSQTIATMTALYWKSDALQITMMSKRMLMQLTTMVVHAGVLL